MSEAQDSATQKLQRGHKILTSGPSESEVLGLAFIRLHSALEDRLRELLANRLPRQRLDIYDLKNFTWKDILENSRTHLGMSEADAEFINQANSVRNPVAHGGDFSWTRERIIQYEQLITQLWATGSRVSSTQPTLTGNHRPAARPGLFPSPAAKLVAPRRGASSSTHRPSQTPWYRAKRFYYLLVSVLLAVIFLLTAGALLWNHFELIQYFTNATQTPTPVPATHTPLPSPTANTTPSPTLIEALTATQAPPQALETGPASGCELVWMEYPGEELDKMNRAMVWSEVVSEQVSGSGLEPAEFYRLVAEQNPFLAADGYVFLKGKTYLLPRCR